MADIVERLRFDSARCEMQFSKGVAGNIEEAAAEIVRLRALIMLGDFSGLRPNSDSFKLVQQIRRERSTGEQTFQRKDQP